MRKTGEQLLIMDWQMEESEKLDAVIQENLAGLKYGNA